MRVTHVITRLIVGGAQENTIASVLGLRARPGLDVDLVSGPTSGSEGSLESWVQDVPGLLTVIPGLVRPVQPWTDFRGYLQLCRHFKARRPHLVHTHSGKAGILGRVAARRCKVPILIHSIHGPSFGDFQGRGSNLLFGGLERLVGKWTDHFVVVADAMTRQYLASGIGRPDQYTRIFSGFPLEPYLGATRDPGLSARLGLSDGDVVVGMIARLFELKGHDDLFAVAPELVRQVPQLKFLLVGDGPWRKRFESMAAAPALRGRFVFAGLVPPSEVPRYVGQMDVLAHLSRREGLPRALPQALAAAIPVVAYDCDGAGEVCRDGETGFLVRVGDRATLVRRLVELAGSGELRRRLGSAGREFVRDRFSVSRLVDDQYALYNRLAHDRGLPPFGLPPEKRSETRA